MSKGWWDWCQRMDKNHTIIFVLETNPSQEVEEDVDYEPTTVICESDGSDDEWV